MAILPHHVLGPAVQALVTIDEDIAKELTAIILQNLREIVFNLLHSLVVWCDSCANKSEWMWVTVYQIDSTIVSMTL